ncbi:MAG: hypothetical protein EXQ70_10765 [Solirubrobacterales bacterium]|nr:hypothetical protein [Solirubrobacterales bacterium]
MRSADRVVMIGIGLGALALAFWLLVLSPKRKEASDLGEQITQLQASISQQEQVASFGEQAREEFPRDYGRLVVLGKAVPADSDTASLIVELQHVSSEAGVQFRGIELTTGSGSTSTTTAAPPSASAPSAATSDPAAAGTTDTSSSTDTTATSSSSSDATTTASATATAPLPTEATASTLPIGATVGVAGLPTLPYKLSFSGEYFQVADFMQGLDRLIETQRGTVRADGRLFTVDGFSLKGDEQSGFPHLTVTLSVTTYVTPSGEGLLNGASPAGPAAPVAPSTGVEATPAAATVTP